MTPDDVPAGPLLVDADVFSMLHLGKGRHEEFAHLVRGHVLFMSFASFGEVLAFPIGRSWGQRRVDDLERALDAVRVLPATNAVARLCAQLHARLHRNLKAGGVNDMWTAAAARRPLPIVTNNLSDFDQIGTVRPIVLVHPDR